MIKGRDLRIAIIGAGASGLMALIKMREAGLTDVTVFEKAAELGGTWHYNRYPGLTCDVPSLAYRYSFAPNPGWSHTFAGGPEILAYLKSVAVRHGVEPFMRFNSEVVSAEYNDGRWRIETVQGPQGEFDAVISAVGVLHHAKFPDIPGVGTFAGPEFHTSQWDQTVDLKDKRVGIIGAGSTATQTVIALTPVVQHLSLFMRTPQWMVRAPNLPITAEEHDAFAADPALLDEAYDRLADDQNSKFAAAVVGENPGAYRALVKACEDHLQTAVLDPELRARLTPDYPVGCKRLIMADGFYEAIQQDHAALVTEAIAAIEPAGVRTCDDRLHELDILVLATGFDTHKFLRPMQVVGQGGQTLDTAWAHANEGYLNVTIPGFPNWFMIGGPNSPVGNFSWLLTAETQFGYAFKLIDHLRFGQARVIVPTAIAAAAFNTAVKAKMADTVWAGGCNSWYIDKNGNVASWPWSWERFAQDMSEPILEDFEIS